MVFVTTRRKKLINTSRSRRGGSRIGKFDECPTRYFKDFVGPASARREETSDGTEKGSIGHTMMAHAMLQRAASKGEPVQVNEEVVTPDQAADYLSPEDAGAACAADTKTTKHLPVIAAAFKAWQFSGVGAKSTPTHIEAESFGVWGTWKGMSGVWSVDPVEAHLLERRPGASPPRATRHVLGGTIAIEPMNVPGHPDHGWPVWITRRRDVVWRTTAKAVQTIDYKFLHAVSDDEVKHNYAPDKWLHIMRLLDAQEYGDSYGGLWLLAIQNHPPHRVNFVKLEPSRTALSIAQGMLWDLEHRRAEWERDDPRGAAWDRAGSMVCNSRYRICPYFNQCHG